MSESVEKRDLNIDELVEGTVESLRQAFSGDTVSDEDSIRKRVEELRQ